MDNCKQLHFLKVPKPMPTKLLIYMTLSLQQNQCKAWLDVLPSVKAAELNTGPDDRRHRQNQTLGKSHIYVYSVIALIRDAGSLAKHCLIVGRMPCFALAWHVEEPSDILLQVGVTIVAYDCFHYRACFLFS